MALASDALSLASRALVCRKIAHHPSHLSLTRPRLGKTTWLLYALIRFLIDKKPIAFLMGKTTTLFLHSGVYNTRSEDLDKFPKLSQKTCCLINLDSSLLEKDYSHIRYDFWAFPVIACPPARTRYKQLEKDGADMFMVPLWSEEELLMG